MLEFREILTNVCKKYQFKAYEEELQNYLDIQPNISEFIRNILDDVRTGKLTNADSIELDEKLKQQKYLKLCLENWKLLKESGHIYEESKAIITGEIQLETPNLQTLMVSQKPIEKKSTGLTELSHCNDCGHQHYGDYPRKCSKSFCNCGVRG